MMLSDVNVYVRLREGSSEEQNNRGSLTVSLHDGQSQLITANLSQVLTRDASIKLSLCSEAQQSQQASVHSLLLPPPLERHCRFSFSTFSERRRWLIWVRGRMRVQPVTFFICPLWFVFSLHPESTERTPL